MFPPIFVTDTKIIYDYNFAAPLTQKVFFSLVFFFYFFLVTFSGRTGKSFLVNIFIISYQESVWPRSDSLLGHTKTFFRKNCSWSCYSWRVWHMTRLMHGNQPPSMKLTLSRRGGLSIKKFQPKCVNEESSTERRS